MEENNLNKNYNSINRDKVISLLLNSLGDDLKDSWDEHVISSFEKSSSDKLDYVNIGEIAHYIKERILSNKTDSFQSFFVQIEDILNNCDENIENFIVIGLLEVIQNVCGNNNINYHTGFDQWLKPSTKKHWDNLIFYWEGKNAIFKFKSKNPKCKLIIE